MPHYNYTTNRYEPDEPVVRPSIRAHMRVWHEYKHRTGRWPAISMFVYFLRFLGVAVGIGACVWYSEQKGWTTMRVLIALGASLVVVVLWIRVEVFFWNLELRKASLSAKNQLWDVTQFPSS